MNGRGENEEGKVVAEVAEASDFEEMVEAYRQFARAAVRKEGRALVASMCGALEDWKK